MAAQMHGSGPSDEALRFRAEVAADRDFDEKMDRLAEAVLRGELEHDRLAI